MKTKQILSFALVIIILFTFINVLTVSATNVDTTNTTDSIIEPNNTFIQVGEPANNVTDTVQVSWTITDINVLYTIQKVWDTERLKWVDGDWTVVDIVTQPAEFTFTNNFSTPIVATVSFEPEKDFNDTYTITFSDNNSAEISANSYSTISANFSFDDTDAENLLEIISTQPTEPTETTQTVLFGKYIITLTKSDNSN